MTTGVINKMVQNEVVEASVETKSKKGNWTTDKRKSYSKTQALERLGETRLNSHGSKMWIIGYTDSQNIVVQFEDGHIAPKATYQQFCNGNIKSPNDRSVYGHGYIGVGKYKPNIDSKIYSIWNSLLQRCYSVAIKNKYKTYQEASICSEWLSFQNYAEWYMENYYDIGETLQIDKDILYPGNKLYSPETCVLVPKEINVLFTKRDSKRGDYPIGVTISNNGKYVSRCQIGTGKKECLGSFDDPINAFKAYKSFKEQRIKEMADKYKGIIPDKLYAAMYRYEVKNDLESLQTDNKNEVASVDAKTTSDNGNIFHKVIMSIDEPVQTCGAETQV